MMVSSNIMVKKLNLCLSCFVFCATSAYFKAKCEITAICLKIVNTRLTNFLILR